MKKPGDMLANLARMISLVLVLPGIVAGFLLASCGPSPDTQKTIAYFEQYSENNPQTVDHSTWNEILRTYVQPDRDGINRFAYAEITSADREALRGYLMDNLAFVPISRYSRAEQLSFWINLYNALTIQLVIDNYPIRSIEDIDISPGMFSKGPFAKKLMKVENVALSLDDIRNAILLPIWKDARIHYVLSYAAVDSPNILPRAITPTTADALLDQAAAAFINHPRGIRIEEDQIVANSLFVWYAKDFGEGSALIDHLLRYADFDLAKYLIETDRIARQHFDWTLNTVD